MDKRGTNKKTKNQFFCRFSPNKDDLYAPLIHRQNCLDIQVLRQVYRVLCPVLAGNLLVAHGTK